MHLFTGRRLSQLTLGPGTWDDINGDGVLDHAQVYSTLDHAERIADDSKETPTCIAEVRTGHRVQTDTERGVALHARIPPRISVERDVRAAVGAGVD